MGTDAVQGVAVRHLRSGAGEVVVVVPGVHLVVELRVGRGGEGPVEGHGAERVGLTDSAVRR